MIEGVNIAGSLKRRLTLTLILGAAALAIVLYTGVRLYAAKIAQQGQDSILLASATSILDSATLNEGVVEVDFPYSALSMLSTLSDDRVFYAVHQDGKLLSGYDHLYPPQNVGQTRGTYAAQISNGTDVRVAWGTRTLVGANSRSVIVVSVAQTQDALAVTLGRISRNVALFGILFFGLAVALSFWATATAINPLRRLTSSVARRGPQDLSPVASPVPTEMASLVASLNQLMGRLQKALAQSEDFIAEAAHRVRTPLATVRSHAEAMLHRVDQDKNRAALRSMIKAIDESSRAAGQLLDHAMITYRTDQMETEQVDLVTLVQDLVLRLAPVAEMKDIHLHLDEVGPVMADVDPILVQNAVRNLIDNALKYSPMESDITILVQNTPTAQITVRDQGPGFPPDQITTLATRFSRGENAAGIIGSGLGLTIAKDVAEAHGGQLTLSNLPEGGACVCFSL